jgi:hypothetical protein
LIANHFSVRDLISDFLEQIGWTCVAMPNDQVFTVAEPESFDAVLVDLAGSGVSTMPSLQQVRETYPALSGRILTIDSAAVDMQPMDISQRPELSESGTEKLLQQVRAKLWKILMELLSTQLTPLQVPAAQLVFDSFHAPRPSGIRGFRGAARQLAYQHKHTTVDFLIEPKEDSGQVCIAGQVLDTNIVSSKPRALAVVLLDRAKILSRTSTNQSGEFRLEFPFRENAEVHICLGAGSWLSIPLGKMEWVKQFLFPPEDANNNKRCILPPG